MADSHDPNAPKPEHDPSLNPAGQPPEDLFEEFELLPEEEGADIVFDLAEEDLPPEQTLDLSEVHEEPRAQGIVPVPVPMPMDEPQSMVFEAEPDFDLNEAAIEPSSTGDTEGFVAFDLPEMEFDDAEHTQGVSREELESLLASNSSSENPTPEPIAEAYEPLDLSDAAAIGEELPLAEAASGVGFIPDAEPELHASSPTHEDIDLAAELPLAEAASGVGFTTESEREIQATTPSYEDIDLADELPVAEAASGVGFVPDAEPEFHASAPTHEDIDLAAELPLAEAASGISADLGEDLPLAESASSTSGVLSAEAVDEVPSADHQSVAESSLWAEAASATQPEIDLSGAVEPVLPASDWFSTPQANREDVPDAVPGTEPAAIADDDIFDVAQTPVAEGSDIFGWKPHASLPGNLQDAAPIDFPKPTPSAIIRESAGSTSRHQGSTASHEDEIDTGTTPKASAEASSIFNELGGPLAASIDGSEVLLQNPGLERTLDDDSAIPELAQDADLPSFTPTDDPAIEVLADLPEDESQLDYEKFFNTEVAAASGSEVPVNQLPTPTPGDPIPEWFSSPGSDLFAGHRPAGEDPNEGRVNPFGEGLEADEPSLSSAPSSIFTGEVPPVPGASHGGSASVRIGDNDQALTVFDQLSNEKDDDADHILGAGAAGPKKPSDSTQEDEENIDWLASDPAELSEAFDDMRNAPASGIFSKTSLPPIQAAPSSIFSKSQLDPEQQERHLDATSRMDSGGNLLDDLFGEVPPSSEASRASQSGRMIPPPAGSEVEVDWLASDEHEPVQPAVEPAFVMAEDDEPSPLPQNALAAAVRSTSRDEESSVDETDERPTPRRRTERTKSGGGMLVGGLAGMLGGLAVGAGVYFSGLVPNSDRVEVPPPPIVKAEPKKDAEIARLKEDLAALKMESEKQVNEAVEKAKKSDGEVTRLLADKEGLENNVKQAEEKLKTLETEANTAKANLKTADQVSKDALAKLAGLEKAATDAEAASKKAAADLTVAMKELEVTTGKLTKAETDAKASSETLASITKSLQDNKLLAADAADPAMVATAVKDAISKAAKPGTAMPAGALTAVEAQELKDSLAKTEAAAKAASEKLTTETTAIKTDYLAQIDTLKKSHADELKKFTEGSPDLKKLQAAAEAALKKAQDDAAVALKKAQDEAAAKLTTETTAIKTDYLAQIDTLKKSHAEEMKKLSDGAPDAKKIQEAAAAEIKKAQEASALAMKELSDKLMAEMTKLKDDYDAKLVAAQKKSADEVARAQAEVNAAKADLAGVMTPSQALDLWLPVLSEARRPADADAAVAHADKVLATASPGSEAFAKAHTVKGLAALIKGNLEAARTSFESVKKDSTYEATKPWAKLADEGVQSLTDPVAKYRKPVDPQRKDPRAAVRYLDEGIRFYNSRRYPEAEKLLSLAVANDSSSPVAWYYLGAARWQIGRREDAKADFQQGAEREMLRTMSASHVEQAIASIQGPVRAAIGDARP